LNKRAASRPVKTPGALYDVTDNPPRRGGRRLGDSVDFTSRRTAHGKMQLWLTTFTVAAAAAVLLVVSMSVLHVS
jgi:hypothetical protein